MKLIGGSRGCGKTTELIKLSSETGRPIICVGARRVRALRDMAKDMGLSMPYPVAVNRYLDYYPKEVVIDDIEIVISALLNANVSVASTSLTVEEIEPCDEASEEPQ